MNTQFVLELIALLLPYLILPISFLVYREVKGYCEWRDAIRRDAIRNRQPKAGSN